ncbi:MAG: mechanosensitive ion channel family protein [Methanobacteriota archaeon]
MALVPFETGGDGLADVLPYLPPLAAIIAVIAGMMWFLAWMSRYFEYLKTLESRWIDRPTVEFVHRVLESLWIVFMIIAVLAIAQTQSAAVRSVLVAFVLRAPAVFFAVFLLFVASLVVRMMHRFAAYLRGELRPKPKKVAPPRALAFTEIVLKYLVYLAALGLAVLGGIRILPGEDQAAIAANVGTLPAPSLAVGLELAAALALVIVADRFVTSIFEDMKRRTRKFSQRVLDDFKAIARYGVWLISAVVVLFMVLDLVLAPERLVVFAIGLIAFLLLLAILAFDSARNALAGVTLMRADPFDVGDRVKIGDDMVCDVVSMGLTTTQVRTLRGERVNLPNTRLVDAPVMNFSRSTPYAISVDLAVDFDVGHERVRDLLVQAALETRGVVAQPAPEALGKELVGSAIVYELLAYTDAPDRMTEIRSSLIFAIQDLFTGSHISLQAESAAARALASEG